jgi:anaerobic selenocysteine-containing dehydrogenase
MGGREVGGLANQLAAHMGFSPAEIDRVGRFWRAPRMAQHEGLKAVAMFEAIARGGIKALWIMATNPAVGLPRANQVRAALTSLDLLVISDNVCSTDTIGAGPHVLLPAAAWGEKDGTVTNSERRISRQRAFAPPAGDAKPDWWAVSEVAKRMGFGAAFDYTGPAAIFREHAALSAFENDQTRDFDLGGLAGLSDADYDALAPLQWPAPVGGAGGTKRMFADGRFFTPSRRARFIAIEEPALAEPPDADFPFLLNTGRVRDQWHTMTRTGLSPKLASHMPDPFVEVNPDDASKLSLAGNGFAWVWTASGSAVLRVNITAAQVPGRIFVPIHWNDETAGRARVGALVQIPTRGSRTRRPFRRTWRRFVSPRMALSSHAGACRCRAAPPMRGTPSRAAMRHDLRPTSLSRTCSRRLQADRAPPNGRATTIPRQAFFVPRLSCVEGSMRCSFLGEREKCRRGAVLRSHGGWNGSTTPRVALSWRAEARPPTSMQAPQSARALA